MLFHNNHVELLPYFFTVNFNHIPKSITLQWITVTNIWYPFWIICHWKRQWYEDIRVENGLEKEESLAPRETSFVLAPMALRFLLTLLKLLIYYAVIAIQRSHIKWSTSEKSSQVFAKTTCSVLNESKGWLLPQGVKITINTEAFNYSRVIPPAMAGMYQVRTG